MFTDIIKLIETQEYETAETALAPLSNNGDEGISSKANYLLGYIYCQRDNPKRSKQIAKKYLRKNINSNTPYPFAYVLFSQSESDSNVALNYLNQGLARFPKDSRIISEIFKLSLDKTPIIDLIKENGVSDKWVMCQVISHLISSGQWDQIMRFIFRLESNNALDDEEKNHLDLIKAYIHLFNNEPDYTNAQPIFETVIKNDMDNAFAYSHYLGIIYAYIKSNNLPKAIEYFDKIPVSNTIIDLDDVPQPLCIFMSFESIYRIIFDCITSAFADDQPRKSKANVLYVLYLYSSSEIYDSYRYKKSDIGILSRYLKTDFNPKIAVAIYNMRCHFKQFEAAYDIFWEFFKHHLDPEINGAILSEILDNATDMEICQIAHRADVLLGQDEWLSSQVISSLFNNIIEKLSSLKKYSLCRLIANHFSLDDIMKSDCAFECAYAYADEENIRAITLYEKIVKSEPTNSSAINNLGVRYEHNGDLHKALECYERALNLLPTDQTIQNNLARAKKLIYEKAEAEIDAISQAITMDELEAIGYSNDFCRKLSAIQDIDMRDILQRDMRECAIAVVAGQDKMATIMCGSIIEALLILQIKEKGFLKYDISAISNSKKATNYPVSDMGLNELLYVADKESIIDKSNYHLGHYVRDYRNVVHPAKEIRMTQDINHGNVITMWAVLRRLVLDLFP